MQPPAYFTCDDELLYNRFHADFGPLHIGHLYRFAVHLHEILGDPANAERGVVFWSKPDSRSRANAACLLACYMVLIQSWPPHLALAPIAQADPPLMPFRDAGYSQADFVIGVQDVVYGVWRAKEAGLCGFKDFRLEEYGPLPVYHVDVRAYIAGRYERYERVDQGDFNWLTPQFVALASPQHQPIAPIAVTSPLYATLPSTTSELKRSDLPGPFKNVLSHFSKRNVGLIVRLNSELYSPSYFTALGINHLDMIFDDGTCPPLAMVKRFIKVAHDMITVKNKAIAVHCKAGLGRTGCLIGAYLIYRHGFTANEIIAFMRFMRPGMVVGPQQHWLHLNQGTFREWWWEDTIKEKLALVLPSTPTKSLCHKAETSGSHQIATPPNGSQQNKRSALGEMTSNEMNTASNAVDENLPAPTPGQPRKASRMEARHHPYSRAISASFGIENDNGKPENESIEMRSAQRQPTPSCLGHEEGWEMRMLSRQVSSHSPASAEKTRTISYSTKLTTTEECRVTDETTTGTENGAHGQPFTEKNSKAKTPAGSKSGNGSGALGINKLRASPVKRNGESREIKGGIRKTSGRVGSIGANGVSRSRS